MKTRDFLERKKEPGIQNHSRLGKKAVYDTPTKTCLVMTLLKPSRVLGRNNHDFRTTIF